MKKKSILKQLDEILELTEIPEYRVGLLAKHEELLRIYQEEIDCHMRDKYYGAFQKSEEYKYFRLSKSNSSNAWDIIIDDCENSNDIFTPELIAFLLSHDVNPHQNIDNQKFYTQKYEIYFSFVRYTEVKIIGQVYWKPLSIETNLIHVVPILNWKNLSEGAQSQIFLEQFNNNKDVREAVLNYFANYIYPYTTAIAV